MVVKISIVCSSSCASIVNNVRNVVSDISIVSDVSRCIVSDVSK